jgi:hypothetical protein
VLCSPHKFGKRDYVVWIEVCGGGRSEVRWNFVGDRDLDGLWGPASSESLGEGGCCWKLVVYSDVLVLLLMVSAR